MIKTWNIKWSDIKLLSLDIFDTLLFRRQCKNPTDIFTHQYSLLRAKQLIPITIEALEWRELRIFAETAARKKAANLCGEVTLEEIYQQLPSSIINKYSLPDLIQVELEVEKKYIEVDPSIAQLILLAEAKGIPYMCVSDTYFNVRQINELLEAAFNKRPFKLPKPQKFYLSSEYKETKSQTLFASVLKAVSISATNILHVGDNPCADIQGAREHKLQAILYVPAPWQSEIEALEARLYSQLGQRNDLYLDSSYAVMRRKAANIYSEDETYQALAAFVYGPIFHRFGRWCLEKAKAAHIKKIYCFTRESHFLVPLLNAVAGPYHDIEVQPLAISRQYASLITLQELNVPSLQKLFYFEEPIHGEEFLTTLGLNVENNLYVKKQAVIPSKSITTLLTLILSEKQYYSQILLFLEQQKEFFYQYLKSINFFTDQTVAVCDLGWSGSTHAFLRKFLTAAGEQINIVGLYFSSTELALDVLSEQDMIYSYLVSRPH